MVCLRENGPFTVSENGLFSQNYSWVRLETDLFLEQAPGLRVFGRNGSQFSAGSFIVLQNKHRSRVTTPLLQNITNQSDINDTRDWVEFPAQTPIRLSSPKNPGERYELMKGSVAQEDLEGAKVRSESEKPPSNPWKSARSPSPVIPRAR